MPLILDDLTSNSAVRNLVMDHTNDTIFQRSYLSRMIRYDTQAAYLGNSPETDFIRAASRMGRWMDPRRPKKLTDEQRAAQGRVEPSRLAGGFSYFRHPEVQQS